jgi:hypothetical protein
LSIREHAENFAGEFVNNFSERCPKLAKIAAMEYISRIGHVLVLIDEIQDDTVKAADLQGLKNTAETHELVEKKLIEIAGEIQRVIARVMTDKDEEIHCASH